MQQQQQWERYAEYVLHGMTDLKETQAEMWKEINDVKSIDISDMKTELAVLKIKCGLWGAIGAALGASVPFCASHFF